MNLDTSKNEKNEPTVSFRSDNVIMNFDEKDWNEKKAKGFIRYVFLFPFVLLIVWVGLNLVFKRNVLFFSNKMIVLITLVTLLSNLRMWLWREYQYSQKLKNKAISTLKVVVWGYIVPMIVFLAVIVTFEELFNVF